MIPSFQYENDLDLLIVQYCCRYVSVQQICWILTKMETFRTINGFEIVEKFLRNQDCHLRHLKWVGGHHNVLANTTNNHQPSMSLHIQSIRLFVTISTIMSET